MDELIETMFRQHWSPQLDNVDDMRAQLYKSLFNQMDGYWSGNSAYLIMTEGGFLMGGKSNTNKRLTGLGLQFIKEMQKPAAIVADQTNQE